MFDFGSDPQTAEAWCQVAARNRAVALTLLKAKHTIDAWGHAGFSVECTLKAAAMVHQRFNRWPTRDSRPDLYSHNLVHLMREAGLDPTSLIHDPIAGAFQTVLLWRRTEGYNPKAMPIKVASDMVEAACGVEGVVEWLCKRYRLVV